MSLSALARDGGADLLLCLHGLGCAKENFADLWDAPALADLALLAPDLPGHGASQGLAPDAWSMEGAAAAVRDLLRDRAAGVRRLHLVVHSSGGAVGLLLAQDPPIPLASFVNVEGNLIAADCALLSRRSAEMSLKLFRDEKFARLKARAREAADPGLRAWADWVEACSAEAFHAAARSVVAWSDSGRLLEMFRELAVPKLYVCGACSAVPEVLACIEDTPKREIPDCGHFVMLERPAEFATILAEFLPRAER